MSLVYQGMSVSSRGNRLVITHISDTRAAWRMNPRATLTKPAYTGYLGHTLVLSLDSLRREALYP